MALDDNFKIQSDLYRIGSPKDNLISSVYLIMVSFNHEVTRCVLPQWQMARRMKRWQILVCPLHLVCCHIPAAALIHFPLKWPGRSSVVCVTSFKSVVSNPFSIHNPLFRYSILSEHHHPLRQALPAMSQLQKAHVGTQEGKILHSPPHMERWS